MKLSNDPVRLSHALLDRGGTKKLSSGIFIKAICKMSKIIHERRVLNNNKTGGIFSNRTHLTCWQTGNAAVKVTEELQMNGLWWSF